MIKRRRLQGKLFKEDRGYQSISYVNEKPYDCNRDQSAHLLPQQSIIAFLQQMELFQIRMGLSPKSNAPRSQSGMYTDFA